MVNHGLGELRWIPAFAGMTECAEAQFIDVWNPPARLSTMKRFFVYLLASQYNGTLYVGVTSNLLNRVIQHKEKIMDGFSKRYGIDRLVWYEEHHSAISAINREKQIKAWKRDWKINLIEGSNPNWLDLYETLA